MKMIKIKCVNKDCVGYGEEETIPAGRPVASHVTEKLGTLVCDLCGHDMWTEPV